MLREQRGKPRNKQSKAIFHSESFAPSVYLFFSGLAKLLTALASLVIFINIYGWKYYDSYYSEFHAAWLWRELDFTFYVTVFLPVFYSFILYIIVCIADLFDEILLGKLGTYIDIGAFALWISSYTVSYALSSNGNYALALRYANSSSLFSGMISAFTLCNIIMFHHIYKAKWKGWMLTGILAIFGICFISTPALIGNIQAKYDISNNKFQLVKINECNDVNYLFTNDGRAYGFIDHSNSTDSIYEIVVFPLTEVSITARDIE